MNLLAIAIISFTLLGYLCFVRVYKKFIHNVLEAASIFNTGQLSVATLYQISIRASRITVTNISTSIAFIIFVCITSYHGIQRLLSLNKVKYIRSLSQRKMKGFAPKSDIMEECVHTQHVNLSSLQLNCLNYPYYLKKITIRKNTHQAASMLNINMQK